MSSWQIRREVRQKKRLEKRDNAAVLRAVKLLLRRNIVDPANFSIRIESKYYPETKTTLWICKIEIQNGICSAESTPRKTIKEAVEDAIFRARNNSYYHLK